MTTTTRLLPLALLALAASPDGQAAGPQYQAQVVRMTCGEASYTLTSSCIQGEDESTLNECKPQSLVIVHGNARRRTTLPELPRELDRQIRASRGGLDSHFVVAWGCSSTGNGPVATLRYSIGGGSAPYSEAWSHYDKTGKLMGDTEKLTRDEVEAVLRHLKKVPSIMPD
jgi:hypothetical protein